LPAVRRVPDGILRTALPPGAFVAASSPALLTISAPATKTASGVRLYDADVYQFTGTPV